MTHTDATTNLPTDADALRALVLSMMAERDAWTSERDVLTAERDALLERNERLHHILLKLNRLQFGCKSERLDEDQLQLGLEDLEQAVAKNQAEVEKRDPALREERATKRRASRGALPAHLPRVEVTLLPKDIACPCCRGVMAVIGQDTSERLDVVPAQYRVIVTHRPKLACRACDGAIVQSPAPPRLIEGGIPTEALVAHVAVARYADHQPLYRQAQMMARQGVLLDRSTLAFWMGYAAAEVAPVVARLREAALLGTYRGILQCDGYAAYKQFVGRPGDDGSMTLAFCWSHVRRGFYDMAKTKAAPIATEALSRIAALYRIETEIRGTSPEHRHAVRQADSAPLVTDLRAWFETQIARLPGRSPTAEAIRYALNHWVGLERFLHDGRIELDSNSVERSMRPIALSRKNALFAGSDEGAETWAGLASLVETCKLNDVNPQAYLTDLLTRLVNGWPQARIDELMPWQHLTPQLQ